MRRPLWPVATLSLLVLVGLASPTGAGRLPELIDVRVGLHAGFTRVVFEMDGPAAHHIDRSQAGQIDLWFEARAAPRTLSAPGRRLGAVRVGEDPSGGSIARLVLLAADTRVADFWLDSPPRLVLDLYPGSAPSGPTERAPTPRSPAPSVVDLRTGQHERFTRVVIETDRPAPYQIEVSGRELRVDLEAAAPHLVANARGLVEAASIEPAGPFDSSVRVELRTHDVEVAELVLDDPPRIVLDLSHDEGASFRVADRTGAAAVYALAEQPSTAQAEEDAPPEFRRRQRPGGRVAPDPDPLPRPAPVALSRPQRASDRWQLSDDSFPSRWWDPYHRNPWKADRPVFGEDWFVNFRAVSDSTFELRRVPTPIGIQGNRKGGSLDVFGDGEQYQLVQNLLLSLSLIQGDTVFRPPDWEFRVTGVQNWNYTRVETVGLLNIDPREGFRRYDHHFGFQELFVDRHLTNFNERYDFMSARAGIQGFNADFRGFLFLDNPIGVRLFGNHLNNRLQWNLAAFRRIEKDTNSGLNTALDLRKDDVYLANLYYQDFPVLGFTLQGIIAYNRNEEGDQPAHYDSNGFIQRPVGAGSFRPHNYDVTYLGLNGDGHFGRLNLTFAAYFGFGDDDLNPIANRPVDIENYMVASEASIDFDWYRLKTFAFYASGDDDPFDGTAEGWDPIFENPNFAGGDTSFWVRQAIPFVGGGGIQLTGRNALTPSLRSSKEEGQSSFVNPGLLLAGAGADFDVLPELRLLTNVSWLRFNDTASLRALRNQGPIDDEIGVDLSAAILYRPLFTENVVVRLSGSVLFPGQGFRDLFGDQEGDYYSAFANFILTY